MDQTLTLEELIENFEFLENWEDRYSYLIELGRRVPPMEEEDKIEENRVKGCQSTVWLKATLEPTSPLRLVFVADSNSHIVKGLVSMLLLMFSGKTPKQILQVDVQSIFKKLGFDRHLSPTRNTGLNAMVKEIQATAEEKLIADS